MAGLSNYYLMRFASGAVDAENQNSPSMFFHDKKRCFEADSPVDGLQ